MSIHSKEPFNKVYSVSVRSEVRYLKFHYTSLFYGVRNIKFCSTLSRVVSIT